MTDTIEQQRAVLTLMLVAKGYPAPVFNKTLDYVHDLKDYRGIYVVLHAIWCLSENERSRPLKVQEFPEVLALVDAMPSAGTSE